MKVSFLFFSFLVFSFQFSSLFSSLFAILPPPYEGKSKSKREQNIFQSNDPSSAFSSLACISSIPLNFQRESEHYVLLRARKQKHSLAFDETAVDYPR